MTAIHKHGKARIFNSPYLELFTKTHPIIHVLYYGGWIAYYMLQSEMLGTITLVLFSTGIFIWTLLEYLIHRYLFHIKWSRFQYIIHGVHHTFPKDKVRLLMPPLPGTVVLLLLFGIFYLLMHDAAFPFYGGVLTGYLLYTAIHYTIHAHKPVKGLKFLWAHHLKHHNPAYEHKAFGVSTTLWDRIFGTMPQ
jgi:sterol desaturase/sphingolipid hydroxylase (fatty acid hydroxylase superfamily)